MKKKVSIILALSLLVSIVIPNTVSVNASDVFEGVTFTDVAYSQTLGVYIATANNASNKGYIFTSSNGYTWMQSLVLPVKIASYGSTNRVALWWEKESIFVVLAGNTIYTSSDGYTWSNRGTTLSNSGISLGGNNLVVGGGNKIRVYTTLSTPIAEEDYAEYTLTNDKNQYIKISLVSDGTPSIVGATEYIKWVKYADETNFTETYKRIAYSDVTFSKFNDKWLIAADIPSLATMDPRGSITHISQMLLSDGTVNTSKLSAIAVSSLNIVVATVDGDIYIAEHSSQLSENTIWQKAVNGSGISPIDEKIQAITPINDTDFLISSQTNLYLLRKTDKNYIYYDVSNYKNITNVYFSKDIFLNTALTEIAYSPELNLYVAAGQEGNKGVIFTSKDGVNWSKAISPNISMATVAGQSMVWWPKEQMFVIMGDGDKSFIYSKDGVSWNWSSKADSIYAGAITVQGEDLYMAGSRKVRKYTGYDSTNASFAFEDKFVSNESGDYFNRIAVSEGTNPTIVVTYQYYGNIGTLEQEAWIRKGSIGGYGKITDITFSNVSNKFFVTSENTQYGTSPSLVTIDKEGTVTTVHTPLINTAEKKPTAITTDGQNFIIGTRDGKLYVLPDTEEYSTAIMKEIPCLDSEANSYRIHSIVPGNNNFIAVASNTTAGIQDSEILVINKDGSGYRRAKNKITIDSLVGNLTFNVHIGTLNNRDSAVSRDFIIAVYGEDGMVKQIVAKRALLPEGYSRVDYSISLDPDIDSSCNMKIFEWESLDSMKPYRKVYDLNENRQSQINSLYVSPYGSDDQDGSISRPFKTLEKARDTVRQLRAKDAIDGEFTIYLREGIYEIDNTFTLDSIDSGTISSPVIYCSYPGENARITAGKAIDAAAFMPISDTILKNRIIDEGARDKLLQINLADVGIYDYGTITRRGHLISANGTPQVELNIDGERMILARWPNHGYTRYSEVVRAGKRDLEHILEGCAFKYNYDRPSYWNKPSDIFVSGVLGPNYAYDYYPVQSIDTEQKIITLREGAIVPYYSKPFFYYENIFEEIDMPGEYYIDRESGILYLYPPETFNPNSDIRITTMTTPLIKANNISNICIKNIHFDSSRNVGIQLIGETKNVSILNCDIRNVASDGILVDNGSNVTISGNHIYNTGSSGISIGGGDYNTIKQNNNIISNNTIHKPSYLNRSYTAGIYLRYQSVGTRVSNNEIYDTPHAAIILYGVEHKIEYNEIHHAVLEFHDMDAIYMNISEFPWERGNVIRKNYFHDIGNQTFIDEKQMNIAAIRSDNGGHGLIVEENIFANIGRGNTNAVRAICALGIRNIVRNNIFVDTSETFNANTNYIEGKTYDMTDHNIIALKNKLDSRLPVYGKKYPELYNFFQEHPNSALKTNKFINNLVVNIAHPLSTINGAPHPQGYRGAEQLVEAYGNYVVRTDPGFANYNEKDFTLLADSEVFDIIPRFRKIPFKAIGTKK